MMSNFKPGKRKNVGHTYAVPAVMIPGWCSWSSPVSSAATIEKRKTNTCDKFD
jgi:hypothetical protein